MVVGKKRKSQNFEEDNIRSFVLGNMVKEEKRSFKIQLNVSMT